MPLTPLALALLVCVAFLAGIIDAVAGGGGLLSMPAILAAGLPPHLALGTNKGQSVFGAAAALLTYTRRGAVDLRLVRVTFPLAFVGSLLGALLVLAISPSALRPLLLVLLPCATLPLLWPKTEAPGVPPRRRELVAGLLALSLGAYDGFFGPGTGTLLVIGFATLLRAPLLAATADAKVVNFASNLAAVAIFSWQGKILWAVALPMGLAQIAGGALGARLAVHGGAKFIRVVVLGIVVALVLKLSLDLAV